MPLINPLMLQPNIICQIWSMYVKRLGHADFELYIVHHLLLYKAQHLHLHNIVTV